MKFITLVSVTVFVICGIFSSAIAAEWITVYSQAGVDCFYDSESVAYNDNGRIKLDTKTFFDNDVVKQKFIQERRNAGLSSARWNELRYFISRIEINCSSKRVNFLSVNTYDDRDNLLTSQNKSTVTEWIPIADNSLLMFPYNAVCGVR
jgi:hypothetical protein